MKEEIGLYERNKSAILERIKDLTPESHMEGIKARISQYFISMGLAHDELTCIKVAALALRGRGDFHNLRLTPIDCQALLIDLINSNSEKTSFKVKGFKKGEMPIITSGRRAGKSIFNGSPSLDNFRDEYVATWPKINSAEFKAEFFGDFSSLRDDEKLKVEILKQREKDNSCYLDPNKISYEDSFYESFAKTLRAKRNLCSEIELPIQTDWHNRIKNLNNQKEKEMKLIETRVYIQGQLASTITDETIFALIANLEEEIASKEKLNHKPEALKKNIEELKESIKELVDYVDKRDNSK